MNILRPAIVPVFLMTSFLIPIRISMPTFQEQDSHNTSPLSSRVIESDIDEAMNEYDDVLEQVNTGGINEDDTHIPFAPTSAVFDMGALDQAGLTATDISVDSKIIHVDESSQVTQVQAVVEVTTTATLKADDDTQIYLAGKRVNELHSSATDYHAINLSRDNRGEDFSITEDTQIDTEETTDSDGDIQNQKFIVQDSLATDNVDYSISDNKQTTILPTSASSRGFNYLSMINYAEYWTSVDRMNPNFPSYHNILGHEVDFPIGFDGSNCANFASQALYAGGLPLNAGSGNNAKKDDRTAWTWNVKGIGGATFTWSGADNNFRYMRDYSGLFKVENDANKAWEGSLIYGDWDANGHYDHMMVVVGYMMKDGRGTPVICQKSGNRHDFPFSQSNRLALEKHGKVRWTALQLQF